MNEKQFTCKGIEWYFLRTFTIVEDGTGTFHKKLLNDLRKNTKKLEIAIILVLILACSIVIWGILQMIPDSQLKSNMNLVFMILNISLIIGAILMWIGYVYSYARINKSAVSLPDEKKELILYKMTENGIYLNLYNRKNKEQMVFLDWCKVRNMSLDHMRYLPFYINSYKSNKKTHEKKLHRLFNNINKKMDAFPYEPKFKYDDIHAVYLLHTNEKYISELPIPLSWHDNGVYEQFITDLKQHVDLADESVLDQYND